MEIKDITCINDYQLFFGEMYGELNSQREWQEIYGYLSRTTGYLTRGLIKGKADSQHFIRPISWLFALANKLDICLQDSFYKKYPGICHYCIERTCCCFRTGKQPIKPMAAYKLIENRRQQYDLVKNNSAPKKLDLAVKNIETIYPNNEVVWHFSGPWMNCSKLFEEVAELHEAICKYKSGEKTVENIEEEIADVLAWILSAWIGSHRGKSLDEEVISYFYEGCPVCLNDTCKCSKDDARIQGLVDAEKFKELRNLFEELEALTPDSKRDVQELIKSLKVVEETQDESAANAAINEANSKVELLSNTLTKTDEVTKKLASIGKSVKALMGFAGLLG